METQLVFVYHAVNLKSFLASTPEKTYKFSDPKNEGLLVTIIGISLSTARGIIFEKLKGTVLDGRIIPIVDPSTFLQKSQTN
jgi:hypothetical protein